MTKLLELAEIANQSSRKVGPPILQTDCFFRGSKNLNRDRQMKFFNRLLFWCQEDPCHFQKEDSKSGKVESISFSFFLVCPQPNSIFFEKKIDGWMMMDG
jgi:hypothetical protein